MRALRIAVLAGIIALGAGAQDIHVNDGGAIREVQRVYVNDASVIREVQRIYVNDGGAIRLVFEAALVTLSGATISDTAPVAASALVRVNTDGTVDELVGAAVNQLSAGTDWVIPNSVAPGSYEILCTLNSGSLDASGATCDGVTWLALTSNRFWGATRAFSGTTSADITLAIRLGADTLSSNTYVFNATVL